MANKKITELPNATVPVVSGTKFEAVQGGINVQVDADDMPGSGASVPDADASTKGIAKLYTSTGGNADGAMDQNSTSNAIALRALINSPTFTGTPAAPTAAPGTNNTQVATTAYADAKVADAINNGTTTVAPSQNAVFDALALKLDSLVTLLTFTASHTLDATDLASINAGDQLVIRQNVASANNLEIPLNATQAFPIGTVIGVRNINTGIVTITAVGGVTLTSPLSAFNLSNQGDLCYIEKTAINTWEANGQLSL